MTRSGRTTFISSAHSTSSCHFWIIRNSRRTQIRSILDEIELANIKVHGYGAENFARNLCQCYERLVERDIQPETPAELWNWRKTSCRSRSS